MTTARRWMGLATAFWCAATPAAVIDYAFVDGFETPADCSFDLSCAPPSSGKACLAGRITEAGAGTPMRAFFHADRSCAEGAIGGACNLQFRAYDALDFAANPTGAVALTATVSVDGCARFRITELTPPNLGFVAIVADDADLAVESDLHVPSVVMRHIVDSAQMTTGANGSALFVNGPFGNYSGLGGEPAGCTWPTVLSAPIAGYVVFVPIQC